VDPTLVKEFGKVYVSTDPLLRAVRGGDTHAVEALLADITPSRMDKQPKVCGCVGARVCGMCVACVCVCVCVCVEFKVCMSVTCAHTLC